MLFKRSTKKAYKSPSLSVLAFWVSLQQLLLIIFVVILALWASASESSKIGWPDHLDMTQTSDIYAYTDSDCLFCPEEDFYSLDCG